MTNRISVDSLSFAYNSKDKDKVLENISFDVPNGEVFCILGPNGTGKSTLLKCLSGLLKFTSGSIKLDGEDIKKLPPSVMAKKMSYVPQSHSSVFPFSVFDVVVMGRTPYLSMFESPSEEDRQIAWQAMETTAITHLVDRPCTEISGGEWQLVLIARALTQQPDIMILDEPTSHLDLGNQMRILNVISSLSAAGLTVVMASHFPDHALLSAGRAAILKDRRLLSWGVPDEIISESSMLKTYGVEVKVLDLEKETGRKVCIPLLDEKPLSLHWLKESLKN